MKPEAAKVFIVDDDASVRSSLANLLESADFDSEEFPSAEDFLAVAPHSGPACLVLDVCMPCLNGLALQERLAAEGRFERIVFITGHGDIPMGIKAMKHGAVDFLPKPFDDHALLEAVKQALAHSAATRQKRGFRAEARARVAQLNAKEYEVFRLLIAGLLNKQIAEQLSVAIRTVKRHRSSVMEKLGVCSMAELTRLAQQAGVQPLYELSPRGHGESA
ncbi:response regulator transcription factor [Phragmitibacter flavus]|uniref:Response regulator transcription factor n=1 Tax=Phragmitibacter flavus TaxID=2576071 RepID=A0A5R8KCY5_9BACT|nr:response regulator [Phragmitibacter flavus]TLD70161.1 response regulator transcription factor [Phragmitibacter flavus]